MFSLCLWREARGEGDAGMVAVGCVLRNRVMRHRTNYYIEVTAPWQFSSITAKSDPQLGLYPREADTSWQSAQRLAAGIIDRSIADVTDGATLYYDDSIGFPASWDKDKVKATVKIGRINFFEESVL